MCGLAGIVRVRNEEAASDPTVARMASTLRYRGPDDAGIGRVGPAVFGHRRLAIIDLAGGRQPIQSEDGQVLLAYNGEVYNFPELRAELQAVGHRFRTRSDTEVVLHAYLEWGESFVTRLRGMFAFALYDHRRGVTLLARDRLGIKPVYYAEVGGALVFGSELKAVLASGLVERRVDEAALLDYLSLRYIPSPKTIFSGVRKLPPAHTLTWREGKSHLHRYWDLRFEPDDAVPDSEWPERIEAKIREAVRMRLVGDVPVGAFLSGGVDSSAVVAFMSEGGRPVRTTTVGFREADYDELDWGRFAADYLGTDHRDFVVLPQAVDALEFLAWHYDEPFGDASAVPTYYVSRATRGQVKVALSGDGGDEAFAGYRRYRYEVLEHRLRDAVPSWIRHFALSPLGAIWPKSDFLPRFLRLKTLLGNVAGTAEEAYVRSVGSTAGLDKRSLLAPEIAARVADHDPGATVRDLYRRAAAPDALGRAQYADIFSRLADGMLTKVDRASMAVGLEVRVPLLDHEVVELAAQVPSRLRIRGRRTKAVLKDALANRLPKNLLERRKRGFGMPVRTWLRSDLKGVAEEAIFASDAVVRDLLDVSRVRSIWDAHQRGTRDASDVLWLVLTLEFWGRTFLRCEDVVRGAEGSAAAAS